MNIKISYFLLLMCFFIVNIQASAPIDEKEEEISQLSFKINNVEDKYIETIETLPKDILSYILYFSHSKDAISLAKTNKSFYNLICNERDSIYRETYDFNLFTVNSEEFQSLPRYAKSNFIGIIKGINQDFLQHLEDPIVNLKRALFEQKIPTINLNGRDMNSTHLGKNFPKIQWCQEVKEINLGNCNLGPVRNEFLNIDWPKKLKTLQLYSNNLGQVFDFSRVQFPQGLTLLNLGNNNLGAVDDFWATELPNSLESLCLANNALGKAKIDASRKFKLPLNLTYLDLSNNDLGNKENILDSIQFLSRLKVFNLGSNKLGTLDTYDIIKIVLPQLTDLNLCNNNFGKSEKNVFIKFKLPSSLKILNLAYNNFDKLEKKDLFEIQLPRDLERLYLSGNNFTTLEVDFFKSQSPQLNSIMM